MRCLWLATALVIGSACGAARPDARTTFEALEARVSAARAVEIDAELRSTGTIASQLEGAWRVADDGVRIELTGSFRDQATKVTLVSDGPRMRGGSSQNAFDDETPPALREGLLIGLTRMGLLHNVAMLAAGRPPAAADGSARTWVTVSDWELLPDEMSEGRKLRPLRFKITVDGKDTAQATLRLDAETGLPVDRRQTVRFPEGEMSVVETYRSFRLK